MSNGIITRNYYNALTIAAAGIDNSGTTTEYPQDKDGNVWLRKGDGYYIAPSEKLTEYVSGIVPNYSASSATYPTFNYVTSYGKSSVFSIGVDAMGVQLGTGDAPLSYEDFKLDEPIVSGIRLISSTKTFEFDESSNSFIRGVKMVLNYTLEAPVTITEFGVFKPVYSGNASSGCLPFLMYRELLTNPITLQQNDNIEINFKQVTPHINYSPFPETDI